jgi:hypothetical protein
MEWHSELPDGRDVAIRRKSDHWIVDCGQSRARSENLDVALMQAIRADADVTVHTRDVRYATWARDLADRLAGGEEEIPSPEPLPSGEAPGPQSGVRPWPAEAARWPKE